MAEITNNEIIRLSKSTIGEEERRAVAGVMEQAFFGMGAQVKAFEEELAAFLDRRVSCVVNGTAALQLALQAAGIGPGDEVLVPSLTYVASFQAISATGAKPVACDVSRETLTLDPQSLEDSLSSASRAVMPVHYSGGAGDLDGIYSIANKNNLRVVEDAAHAFGSSHQGKRIGSFGDIACFSFDGIKNITSGEGGCVVSDDLDVVSRINNLRLLGVVNDTEKRYSNQRSWDFEMEEQGWRYHMSDIMAALGRAQLKKQYALAKRRCHLASLYDSLFSSAEDISVIPHDYAEVVPHIYTVRIRNLKDRDSLRSRLMGKGIQTGTHYKPNHFLSLYKDSARKNLEATEEIWPEILTLPLHPELNDDQVEYVAETLLEEVTV